MHRRVVAAALAVIGLCAAGAAAASAAPVALGGSPLNVYVGERGQLQAFRAPSPDGIYYRSTSTTGDAGFFLAVPGAPGAVYGFLGNAGPREHDGLHDGQRRPGHGQRHRSRPLEAEHHLPDRPGRPPGHADDQLRQRESVLHRAVGGHEHRHERRAFQGLRRGGLLLRRQRSRYRHLHAGSAAVHRRNQRRHRQLGRLRRGPGHHAVVALPGARVWRRAATRSGARSRARRQARTRPSTTRLWASRSTTPVASSGTSTPRALGCRTTRQRPSRSSRAAPFPRRCRSTRPTPARPRACRSTSPSAPSTPTARRTRARRSATRSPARMRPRRRGPRRSAPTATR